MMQQQHPLFEIGEYQESARPLTSDRTTRGIRVQAFPYFVQEQSNPSKGEFLFSYHIIITNNGTQPVRLLSRHWIIINANGYLQEVRGPGVVGKTPYLEPGESFEYASFCPLNTDWGTMEGLYQLQGANGEVFDIAIGRFYLTTTAPRLITSG